MGGQYEKYSYQMKWILKNSKYKVLLFKPNLMLKKWTICTKKDKIHKSEIDSTDH